MWNVLKCALGNSKMLYLLAMLLQTLYKVENVKDKLKVYKVRIAFQGS